MTERARLGALLVHVAGYTVLLASYNPPEMYLYTILTSFPIRLLGMNPNLLAGRRWTAALALLVGYNNVSVLLQMVR